MAKKLVVVLSSLCYPVTMARFFWEAFERRDDCEVHMVGPYFGQDIPWNGGIKIDWKYVKVPDIQLPRDAARFHLHPQMVLDRLPKDIDLFLQIDAGWHFSSRPPGHVVGLVQTDPHVLNYDVPRSYSDFSFCMQTPYMQGKDVYLPYALDQVHFYPEERKMVHDAALIGLHYEQRTSLVNRLRQGGLDVYYDIGVVYDDYRAKYNESRVALCWSSMQDLPVRVWEAMGMARPLVVNRNIPDLHNFFVEGEHFLGFDTVEEGVAQVRRFVQDPDFADRVRWSAFRKVTQGKHTWDDRVQQILETCKLVW